MRTQIRFAAGIAMISMFAAGAHAGLTPVRVTIENLAPAQGTHQTPFWVGFHNGGFDIYNSGEAASEALERLAEDGTTSFLSDAFVASGNGSADGAIAPGGPFAPGDIASMTFMLDGDDTLSRYFSYASMVIPSNDAFVANGNGFAHEIFDAGGNFIGADFFITGANVLDAGTEVNDELPMNTAFFGQSMPDTGMDENGVVHAHPGYLGSSSNPGTQMILADPMFTGADFTLDGYPIARVVVTQVPAPGALAMLGLAGLIGARRSRRG